MTNPTPNACFLQSCIPSNRDGKLIDSDYSEQTETRRVCARACVCMLYVQQGSTAKPKRILKLEISIILCCCNSKIPPLPTTTTTTTEEEEEEEESKTFSHLLTTEKVLSPSPFHSPPTLFFLSFLPEN